MKNAVFCDIKTQFVLHGRHTKSPLQSSASKCCSHWPVTLAHWTKKFSSLQEVLYIGDKVGEEIVKKQGEYIHVPLRPVTGIASHNLVLYNTYTIL
jgi:hypothetical protein